MNKDVSSYSSTNSFYRRVRRREPRQPRLTGERIMMMMMMIRSYGLIEQQIITSRTLQILTRKYPTQKVMLSRKTAMRTKPKYGR
jgi:hypothetical protein